MSVDPFASHWSDPEVSFHQITVCTKYGPLLAGMLIIVVQLAPEVPPGGAAPQLVGWKSRLTNHSHYISFSGVYFEKQQLPIESESQYHFTDNLKTICMSIANIEVYDWVRTHVPVR